MTSSPFTRPGRAFLEALELRPEPRRRLAALLRLIDDIDRELLDLQREIDAFAGREERVQVLTGLPGIGNYLGVMLVAQIGHVHRFPSARHLCSWAGLAPKLRSCDGKLHLGHITHQGPRDVRRGLCLAAQTARRREGPLKDAFDRVAARRGHSIATVALARRMLTLSTTGCATAKYASSHKHGRTNANRSMRRTNQPPRFPDCVSVRTPCGERVGARTGSWRCHTGKPPSVA